MTTAAKYAKETSWAIAAKMVGAIFYYGLVYYLTRRMTVGLWGEWSAFVSLLNVILMVSDQGINTATKRYVAIARETADLAGVVRGTLILRFGASVLYAGLIALVLHRLLPSLGQAGNIGLMERALLLVVLYGLCEYFKNLFEALHRLRFTFVVIALEHALKFFLVIALYRGGDQFVGIVAAFTAAVGIAVVAGFVQARGAILGIFRARVPPGLIRQVYLYSLPVLLTSIGGFISLEVDVIMLRNMRSSYETGIYAAAKQIVMFLPQISLVVSMASIPGISVFDQSTAMAQRRIFYRILCGLMGICLLVGLGLVAFALWGIRIFFPPDYSGSAAPLLVLIPFVLFNAVTIYTGNLMIYRGLAWQRSLNALCTIIGNILLNYWLIPIWGPVGAAASSSIAYLPYCLFNLRAAHRAFQSS